MSFQQKTDYLNLGSTSLILVSSSENRSSQTATAQDSKGDIIAQEIYGTTTAPKCSYVVKSDTAVGNIKIGKASGLDNKYTITNLTINTSAGSPPSVEASGEEIPSSTHDDCWYNVPSTTVEVCHHAQILFGAFSLTGAGNYLTQANYTVSGDLTKATKEGETVAWDIANGQIKAALTIVSVGETAPTVTPGDGWTMTTPLTLEQGDAAYNSYTCELTLPLVHATAN